MGVGELVCGWVDVYMFVCKCVNTFMYMLIHLSQRKDMEGMDPSYRICFVCILLKVI